MIAEIMRQAGLNGFHSDIVVHREELIDQSEEKIIAQTGIKPGIVWQNRREWDSPIRILSHGTLAAMESLPEHIRKPDILFLDEAHHGTAPGWKHAIKLLHPKWLIGMTATPFRNDREPLVPDPFGTVIRTIQPQELIDIGVLVPPIVVSPGISDNYGEPQPISQASNLPGIYVEAIKYAIARGRTKIILFTSSNGKFTPTQVALKTSIELETAGIQSGTITEECSSRERKRITGSFEKMPTSVLLSYMTLTEGFDSKCVDCVILGRNSRSESTIIQMIGRGLREYPGKTSCLVLNFTGRKDINNIINYWRLDSDPKSEKEEREKRNRDPSEKELDDLTAAFPKVISAMASANIEYPWFQPYEKRRLRALCLWNPDNPDMGNTYVCVEPTSKNKWQVSRVKIPRQKRSRITTISKAGLSSQEAADAVNGMIGEKARAYNRNAQWRRQAATDKQKRTWNMIHDTDPPENLTRGDASDAISLVTFTARVSPKLV